MRFPLRPVVGLFLACAAGLPLQSSGGGGSPEGARSVPRLWYQQPAARWLEALPVGNGRLGAMVFGGIGEERLALNESTFWSGESSEEHDPPGGREAFIAARRQLAAGRPAEAEPFIGKLLGRELNYGTCLPAGDLLLEQSGVEGRVTEYRRELDLDAAVAGVEFIANGIRHRRELLASHPDGVLALRLTADRTGSVGFTVRYRGGKFPWSAQSSLAAGLAVTGRAFETKHSNGRCGVAFRALVRVIPEGGRLSAEGDRLRVEGADAATVLVALNTDFRGQDAWGSGERQLERAVRKGWARIRDDHLADHRRLFRRVSLRLGPPGGEDGPTDTRLKRLAGAAPDLGLEGLFFQYGRYLLIAGSREDSPLPLHLQGLWNDGLAAEMGWTCDYHLDINTEQNYWPSEVANLAECGEPLFRFVESLQTPGRRTARAVYGIDRGWVCHVFSNPWGFTSPGWGRGWGLHVTGGAWVATHLWEHYRFTGDRRFLAQRAYPVLKGAAEFFLDYLYPDPATGFLVTGPSVSPERGGEAGPAAVHDRGVVAELFDACIEASRLLGVDAAWRARVAEARRRLPPYEVGRNGQLLEWVGKDDGGETNHRHTSHLVGLAPFGQITPRGTPELARAARRSLELRMGRKDWEDVEWSAGNSLCYFARLGAGEEAHQALVNLLTQDSDLNLMTYSRGGIAGATENIFAIDGNTSGTLGVAEMLVQSHAGEIDLLPALPEAWSEGEVQGLRARGGEIVDIAWRDRKVARYRITSVNSTPVKVRLNGAVVLAQPVRP